jgi:hypothetical protein
MHNGVIDTAVMCTAFSLTPMCKQLCQFSPRIEAIFKKALARVSGAQGKLFEEKKKPELKISCQSPFKYFEILLQDFTFASCLHNKDFLHLFFLGFHIVFPPGGNSKAGST